MRTARTVSSCSLVLWLTLGLTTIGRAGTYSDLDKRLQGVSTKEQAVAILDEVYHNAGDRPNAWYIDNYKQSTLPRIKEQVRLRASLETGATPAEDTAAAIRRVSKGSKFDPKARSDWLGRASDDFSKLMDKLFLQRRDKPPKWGTSPLNGEAISFWHVVVYALLGCLLLAFLFGVFKAFGVSRAKTQKRSALLDEDEPERTLDEWLERAAKLALGGRHREAVRALYVACLLRYDEAGIARFVRHETNWDHLKRIEASPVAREPFEFRHWTREFDAIWYGMRTRGEPDYLAFREAYERLSASLQAVVA